MKATWVIEETKTGTGVGLPLRPMSELMAHPPKMRMVEPGLFRVAEPLVAHLLCASWTPQDDWRKYEVFNGQVAGVRSGQTIRTRNYKPRTIAPGQNPVWSEATICAWYALFTDRKGRPLVYADLQGERMSEDGTYMLQLAKNGVLTMRYLN